MAESVECPSCGGRGRRIVFVPVHGPLGRRAEVRACPVCAGKGLIHLPPEHPAADETGGGEG